MYMHNLKKSLFAIAIVMATTCTTASAQVKGYFSKPTSATSTPDDKGFIRRWSLLEPIVKENRSNIVFIDSYLRDAFSHEYFKGQQTVVPKDGDKVKIGEETLQWHSLESDNYNVKLFRFGEATKNRLYGVLYWAVTVVKCDKEMKNVRLAVGSNSASMWWVNGEEALLLSGDRRMVVDDGMSKRITLKKGTNIIRGAVINGPGMSDFCVRFVDEKGEPIKNLTIN